MVMKSANQEVEGNKTTVTIVVEDMTEAEARLIDKVLRGLRVVSSDIEYMKRGGLM